jgi:NADH:ubiquinone oxidoreductase subunit 2 (subunit N)
MSFIVAYSGQISFELIKNIFGEGGLLGAVITVALLIIIIYIMFKIDWEKIFEKYVAKNVEKKE